MKKLFIILLLLTLTGCSLASQTKEEPPSPSAVGNNQPEEPLKDVEVLAPEQFSKPTEAVEPAPFDPTDCGC